MEKAQAVILDLDGTLFNEASEISEYSLTEIRRLHSRGISFGIATGRPISSVEYSLERQGIRDCFSLIAGMNGSNIKNLDTGHYEEILAMPAAGIAKLLDLYADYPGSRVLCDEGHVYADSPSRDALWVAETDHLELVITDFSAERRRDWLKAAIFVRPEQLDGVVRRYESRYRFPEIVGKRASAISLEFTHRATDKGVAIQYLAGQAHLPLAKIIGIGDSGNDAGMLRTVGHPVAMLNGSPEAKQLARDITEYDNLHDGALRYLASHPGQLELS